MQIEYKFRHAAHSEELTAYVGERISRLEKFELKPVKVEVTFSAEKSTSRVDIHVRGEDLEIHAHGEGATFFESADSVLVKIGRQLEKKKARVQSHKGAKVS